MRIITADETFWDIIKDWIMNPGSTNCDGGISIGMATFMRPNGLRNALEHLGRLSLPVDKVVDLVVVDNDSEGSGIAVCETFRHRLPFNLTCLVEPQRGMSYVRNRAIEHAVARNSAFLVFMDDDEAPDPQWLIELLRVQLATDADMVGGPVVADLPSQVPAWVLEAGLFRTKSLPDGGPVEELYTGNLLIAASVFRDLGLRFDDRFALNGGEDMDYTRCARRLGMKMVWAAYAVVHETVPEFRLCAGWLFRRKYRCALTFVRHQMKFSYWPCVAARNVFLGCGQICYGLIGLATCIFKPFGHRIKWMFRVVVGLGLLGGVLGLDCREYAGTVGKERAQLK